MEQFALALSVANLALLILGGLLLRSYFPAYLSEKGKNHASKEDVAHLTQLVEAVKSQHIAELERLKATLLSEGQVIERRRRVYEEVCGSLRIFIEGHAHPPEAQERFHAAYAAAWLWASDAVLASLNTFIQLQLEHAAAPGSIDQGFMKQTYTETLLAMRKDVGFPQTVIALTDYKFVQF